MEWEGTLEATGWKRCLQSAKWMGRDEVVGEEDCLALNVHTDQVDMTNKLVIFKPLSSQLNRIGKIVAIQVRLQCTQCHFG